jgi:hypothetical protein
LAPRRQQRRHDEATEMVEWRLVAKEERLTGRRRLDHRGHERGVAAGFERQHQVAHAAEPCLSGERKQTTFQEIVLVGAEREARVLFQGLPEKIVVKRRHD